MRCGVMAVPAHRRSVFGGQPVLYGADDETDGGDLGPLHLLFALQLRDVDADDEHGSVRTEHTANRRRLAGAVVVFAAARDTGAFVGRPCASARTGGSPADKRSALLASRRRRRRRHCRLTLCQLRSAADARQVARVELGRSLPRRLLRDLVVVVRLPLGRLTDAPIGGGGVGYGRNVLLRLLGMAAAKALSIVTPSSSASGSDTGKAATPSCGSWPYMFVTTDIAASAPAPPP